MLPSWCLSHLIWRTLHLDLLANLLRGDIYIGSIDEIGVFLDTDGGRRGILINLKAIHWMLFLFIYTEISIQ